jgi:hypothetical protein
MPEYRFSCTSCEEETTIVCKMSQKRTDWPQCPLHGDSMKYNYDNTNPHVDHTDSRKGFHNSKEGNHR